MKAAMEEVVEEHAREGLPSTSGVIGKVAAVPAEEFRKRS
jgi:hypothetical protein